MTEIRLLYAGNILQGYQVSGHTGAGTEGNDLVCAAVSFLATTCANALETVTGAKPQVRQGEGHLAVVLPTSSVCLWRGDQALKSAHARLVAGTL